MAIPVGDVVHTRETCEDQHVSVNTGAAREPGIHGDKVEGGVEDQGQSRAVAAELGGESEEAVVSSMVLQLAKKLLQDLQSKIGKNMRICPGSKPDQC